MPDVAFVSWERLDAMTPGDELQPTSPDIAIEVRSPSNDRDYVREKVALYLAKGTLLVLDVVPSERAVVAYAAEGQRRYESGETFEHPAVAWLRVSVSEAFENLDRLMR